MNKNINIALGAVVLIIIIAVMYYFINKNNDMMMSDNNKEPGKEMMSGKDAMMNKDEMMKDEIVVMKTGSYETYNQNNIMSAKEGKIVLFFHASWCPSCQALNSSIEKNIKSIPSGTTILKTDYDKEVELKKKYGVTYQHTLVQVDNDGNMIKKWSGSPSLDSILSQIQ